MSALQYCELLAKGEVFQKQPTMSVEEAPDRSRQEPNGVYPVPVLSHSACGWQRRMLLKSQADRILAKDNKSGQSIARSVISSVKITNAAQWPQMLGGSRLGRSVQGPAQRMSTFWTVPLRYALGTH
jgi:hypothetical protein